MSSPEVEQTLKEGIEAVKRGQRVLGRKLLLKVVSSDDQNEQGWFWLSMAVDKPEDKIVALENVLTINPANPTAQANLNWLKNRAGAGGGGHGSDAPTQPTLAVSLKRPVTAPLPASLPPQFSAQPAPAVTAAGLSEEDLLDDPQQCVYCGASAPRELKRCPNCRRSLMEKRARSPHLSGTLRTAAFVVMLQIGLAMAEAIGVIVIVFQGRNWLVGLLLENFQQFYGDFHSWSAVFGLILSIVSLMRIVILILLLLGLLARFNIAYYASVSAIALDLVLSAFAGFQGYLGPAAALLFTIVDVVALSFIFAAERDFEVNEERVLCMVERGIKGGVALNRLGRLYRNRGKWALALLHWRRAIGASPNQPEFYKDAAVGYAQLGYYHRALDAVQEAIRQSQPDPNRPADTTELQKLKTLIESKQAGDPAPRG